MNLRKSKTIQDWEENITDTVTSEKRETPSHRTLNRLNLKLRLQKSYKEQFLIEDHI